MEQPLPSVVIVGRPNVGKSTLFNAITGRRRAIVGDEPGITRDRLHGEALYAGRRFQVVDTGGLLPSESADLPAQILKQARVALERAAHIIFLIDGRSEITAADRDLAQLLRRLGKPVSLAVNKIDVPAREELVHDFHSLGIPDVFPVSAEHHLGLDELLEHVTASFPLSQPPPPAPAIRVAIIGRPNVGKSTLLNALVGQQRAIVSPTPGTTRDAVDETVVRDGVPYVFVDTAGIRRKGKTRLMAEKLSVMMARRHIRLADVALLVLDAAEGVVGLDAAIAGYAHQQGRALICCVNKWDLRSGRDRPAFERLLRGELKFLDYAPVAFVSALTGAGVPRLFELVREAYRAASQRIPTGELNRLLAELKVQAEPRILYLTQASVRPPTFVVFTDRPEPLHFSRERYLVNRIRERFGFQGAPIVIKTRVRRSRARS
jgi:GTP-binding protein